MRIKNIGVIVLSIIFIVITIIIGATSVLGFIGFCATNTSYNNGLGYTTSCNYGCNDTVGTCYKTTPYPGLPTAYTESCQNNDLANRVTFHFNNVAAFGETTSLALDQSVYGQAGVLSNIAYVYVDGVANNAIRSTTGTTMLSLPYPNSMYNNTDVRVCMRFKLDPATRITVGYGGVSGFIDGNDGAWQIGYSYPGLTVQWRGFPNGVTYNWYDICWSFTPDFYDSSISFDRWTFYGSSFGQHRGYSADGSSVAITATAAGVEVDDLQIYGQQDRGRSGCPCAGTTCASGCNLNNEETRQCNNNLGSCDVLSTELCAVGCADCPTYCSNPFTSQQLGFCDIGNNGTCSYTPVSCVAPAGCNGAVNSTCHCIENWNATYTPATCAEGTPVKTYRDLNNCGTTLDLPDDNGTILCCGWCQWQKESTHIAWDNILFPKDPAITRATYNFDLGNSGEGVGNPSIVAKGYVYTVTDDGWVYQNNATNVKNNFRKVYIGTYNNYPPTSPIYADNYIYVINGDGILYKLSAADISQILATSTDEYDTGSRGGIYYNGFLYIGDVESSALYKLSGFDLSVVEVVDLYTNFGANVPAAVNGFIYVVGGEVGSDGRYLQKFDANNISAGPIAEFDASEGGPITTSPVIFLGGADTAGVYIGLSGTVLRLDLDDLSYITSSDTSNQEVIGIAVTDSLAIGYEDPDAPEAVWPVVFASVMNGGGNGAILRIILDGSFHATWFDLGNGIPSTPLFVREVDGEGEYSAEVYITILCGDVDVGYCTIADTQFLLQIDALDDWNEMTGCPPEC